jgi:hypothetical protein
MTGYSWTISPGGTITAGGATNSITVTWSGVGAQNVSVSYTNGSGCAAATPSVYAVNVTPLPTPTISGPGVVCANAAGIVYTTEAGMTNYNWAVSIGGTITAGAGTNSITVLWPYAGQRNVSVTYSTPTGCAAITPTVFNVTINPAAVPIIGSSNNPCINSTNNQYITNSGMSGYAWNISSGGTIVSGQGTSTINVTWSAIGAQWVSVSYTNTYGCAAVTPTVYNLFVNPLPNAAGAITGTTGLCAGTSGVEYMCAEILNATSYSWTLPAGASISAGAGTNHITVNFSLAAVSGNISVAGINSCGTGNASPNFSVTVYPIPPAPVVTANGAILTSSAPSGNQWYYEGASIPGANGKVYTAIKSGYHWCEVTLNGCISPISNKVYVVITGKEEFVSHEVRIFPVPNKGRFSIALGNMNQGDLVVAVYNPLGIKIYEETRTLSAAEPELQIDLGRVESGVYFVTLTAGNKKVVRKMVVNE